MTKRSACAGWLITVLLASCSSYPAPEALAPKPRVKPVPAPVAAPAATSPSARESTTAPVRPEKSTALPKPQPREPRDAAALPDSRALPFADSSAGRLILDQFRDQLGGGVVDELLTQEDQRHLSHAGGEALERRSEGQTVSWRNPETGHSGEVVVNSAFRGPKGRRCKRITQKVRSSDENHVLRSVACRLGENNWGGF